MNFFIATAGLTAERLATLRAVGTDFEIDGTVGVVVAKADLPRGVRVVATAPSSYDGIEFATLEWVASLGELLRQRLNRPSSADVRIGHWQGGRATEAQRADFAKSAEVLLPHTGGRDIVVHFTDSQPFGTVTPVAGAVNIVLGVGRRTGDGNTTTILGKNLGDYSTLELVDGQYLRDEAGVAFVRRVSDSLYEVPHLIGFHCSDKERVVFDRILEELRIEFLIPSEERVRIRSEQVVARREASKKAYVAECGRRFEKTVAGTHEAIRRGRADVESLQQQLVRRIRETSGAERKLEQLLASKEGEAAKYVAEFDKLVSTRKVRDVVAEGGVIKLFTDTLFCVDPRTGKRHEIGAFRIEIATDRGDVRWYNLTRKVNSYQSGMQAPHVFPDGKACLGTAAEILPQLIGTYEFAAAAMVAIQFVESVNTDDAAGRHINRWPLAG